MGEVLLDSIPYTVKDGTIQRRNINPRAARFETGIPGYSSFTQGSAEAWKGLRGGIGHKYQISSGTEECYFSQGLDATHNAGVIQGPKINTAGTFGAAPVKIIDFGGETYAIGDDLIAEWNDPSWTERDTGVSDPLDAIVVRDSTATYLIVTNATGARYTTDGSSWSALTGPMGYMAIHDNKVYAWYDNVLYNSPAKASDGTWDITGTWGSCKYLDYVGTVYGLFTARSQNTDEPLLCLHSSEGLYTIDPWVQEIYPYIELTGHTHCGHAGMFWNSYIWVSSLGGIKKISQGLVTDVGTDQDDGLPKTYQGYVSDMAPAGDGSWMVFSVQNASSTDKSSIFKRHGTVGGNQQIYTTSSANVAITCVHYSPSHLYTNGRLWWGEGTDVKYCMFPDFNADVTEIPSYEFVAASGKLVYSVFKPMEAFPKTAMAIAGATAACDTNKKFTIYYRINADTVTAIDTDNWTTLGTFTTSPDPTALSFGDDEGLVFYAIQLAVDGVTDVTTTTPILRSLELDYDVGAPRLRGWTFPVSVAGDDARATLDSLHTSQAKDTLLLFYPSGNKNDTSYRVKINTLPENITWDASQEHGEVMVTVGELIRR
jgi:hypothetical protein